MSPKTSKGGSGCCNAAGGEGVSKEHTVSPPVVWLDAQRDEEMREQIAGYRGKYTQRVCTLIMSGSHDSATRRTRVERRAGLEVQEVDLSRE